MKTSVEEQGASPRIAYRDSGRISSAHMGKTLHIMRIALPVESLTMGIADRVGAYSAIPADRIGAVSEKNGELKCKTKRIKTTSM